MDYLPSELSAPLEDTPIFHWFVVTIVVFCLWFSQDAPGWVQIVTGLVFLRVITWHSAFHSRTTLSLSERMVTISRLTPFGRRETRLSFDEISEVRIQKKLWGNRDSRQVRGTLNLCTLNKTHSVIYSSRDIERMTRLSDALREVLDLHPTFKALPALEEPMCLSEGDAEALKALCQGATDGERILGPQAVSETMRQAIETHLGMPTDEPLWCFIDTAMAFKGRYGLAIGAKGLYWANDAELKEHTKLRRLSWDDIGKHTFSADPADNDIMVGTTSQIGIGVFTNYEAMLSLLLALQSQLTGDTAASQAGGALEASQDVEDTADVSDDARPQ